MQGTMLPDASLVKNLACAPEYYSKEMFPH